MLALQVKLVSARGLHLDGYIERLQARLLLPNRRPLLSGAVQLARPPQQEIGWEHEEQFTEVCAIVPETSILGSCRACTCV